MESWPKLVTTALMGTSRQAPSAPASEGALKSLVDQLDWHQPERALLGVAGAIALHQQVGWQPVKKDWPSVKPCALDDLPYVANAIARYLEIAWDRYAETLPELLSLIAQAGQRVPERQLPKLLQLGQQTAKLRPIIAAAVGKRGQWLAAQNSDWGYAQVAGGEAFEPDSPQLQAVWQNGRRSERVLLLQRWRQADPDAARVALEAIWSTVSAKEREVLINELGTNLTMADEPFLEAALSDRAKSVRQAAAHQLVRLPNSRLCQRMTVRTQPLVQLQGEGRSFTVAVTLPAVHEPEWAQDGIPAKAQSGKSQRGGWLEQLLAATPLDAWGNPSTAIPATQNHAWQEILIRGWGLAAERQQRADWAAALASSSAASSLLDNALMGQLLALLPAPQQAQQLQAQLPSQPTEEDSLRWLNLVAQSHQDWDLAFSQSVLARLVAMAQSNPRKSYALAYETRNLRLTLHPDLAPEVAIALERLANIAHTSRHWESSLLELLQYLSFRREIRQAFQAQASH
ncbi:MAG: DUF5691 domain-containing protein [Cyanobacteria bacterium J06638_28]